MGNFFKPAKDGTILHLTKNGRWEKCNIPVGCTRHVDLSKLDANNVKDVELFGQALDNEWSEEAYLNKSTVLSPDDYNGYVVEDDDEFDDMKVDNGYVLINSYYNYACKDCGCSFEPSRNVETMDSQVAEHKCEELSSVDMQKKRKIFKLEKGISAFMKSVDFKPLHESCKSYQTSCRECAQKHEDALRELFSKEELSCIVREDSGLYDPSRVQMVKFKDVTGEQLNVMSNVVRGVLDDFPEFMKWPYLPNKSKQQLELEQSGINYGNHKDDDNNCRVCRQYVYDMYCMECWTPPGYLDND